MNGEVTPIGKFQRRASNIVSNGKLYDLVEDMAQTLDKMVPRFDMIEQKLDTILEKLDGKAG